MVTARPLATVEHHDKPTTIGKEVPIMDQLTHLGDDTRHQRPAYADQQRPAKRPLAVPGPPAVPSARPGVLSHIEGTENRISILNSIRSALTRKGLLLLTVPHALRRFPLHASSDGRSSESSGAFPGRGYARRYFPTARPVTYQHRLENEDRLFPYYLFSRRELAAELSAAGLTVEVFESDSILPERILARNPTLAPVDDVLCRLLPTWAGYGL